MLLDSVQEKSSVISILAKNGPKNRFIYVKLFFIFISPFLGRRPVRRRGASQLPVLAAGRGGDQDNIRASGKEKTLEFPIKIFCSFSFISLT